LAAGRPLLYIGPREATPARIIERFQCGWQVDPGDTAALASLLHKLDSERHLIFEAGDRARAAFERYYDRPTGAARIVRILGLEPGLEPAEAAPLLPNPLRAAYPATARVSESRETASAS
jgi:hypothetical protein